MKKYKVKISGWNKGYNKVQSTNLIQHELGLNLKESKSYTDQVLGGVIVTFEFGSKAEAINFSTSMEKIGAISEIIICT